VRDFMEYSKYAQYSQSINNFYKKIEEAEVKLRELNSESSILLKRDHVDKVHLDEIKDFM